MNHLFGRKQVKCCLLRPLLSNNSAKSKKSGIKKRGLGPFRIEISNFYIFSSDLNRTISDILNPIHVPKERFTAIIHKNNSGNIMKI